MIVSYYIVQAGLELLDPSTSASRGLRVIGVQSADSSLDNTPPTKLFLRFSDIFKSEIKLAMWENKAMCA